MNQVFMAMPTLDLFIKERKLFLHESANGFYRTSVYFCGKIACDILPNQLLPTFINCLIVYWMVGEYAYTRNFYLMGFGNKNKQKHVGFFILFKRFFRWSLTRFLMPIYGHGGPGNVNKKCVGDIFCVHKKYK